MATAVIGVALVLDSEMVAAEKAAKRRESLASRSTSLSSPSSPFSYPTIQKRTSRWRTNRFTCPAHEFLRLWKQAHPDKEHSRPTDVQTVVSHAHYSGRVQDDVARFNGRLQIHHFDDEWGRVRLPLGDVALEKVEINGDPATVVGDDTREDTPNKAGQPKSPEAKTTPKTTPRQDNPPGDGGPAAIFLEEAGTHVVDLQFSVPVSRLGETGRLTVPLRSVSSGRLLFQLPADDLDIQVSGAAGGWCRRPAGSVSENAIMSMDAPRSDELSKAEGGMETGQWIRVPLGAAGKLSIRWQPRQVEQRQGHVVSADQSILVEVRDSGIHLHNSIQYRIQRGRLSELQLRVPPDVVVQHVDGSEVADWSIETEPAGDDSNAETRRLIIDLKTEMTTQTDVIVQCFRRNHSGGAHRHPRS